MSGLIYFMSGLPAGAYVHLVCLVPAKVKRGSWIPENWSYRYLSLIMNMSHI